MFLTKVPKYLRKKTKGYKGGSILESNRELLKDDDKEGEGNELNLHGDDQESSIAKLQTVRSSRMSRLNRRATRAITKEQLASLTGHERKTSP